MDSGTYSIAPFVSPATVTQAPRLLVSPPRCARDCEHAEDRAGCGFQIAWAINPHMRVGAAETGVAVGQHAAFVDRLVKLGAEVIEVPFVHGAFDSVFMKDAAVLVRSKGHDRALLATLAHAERAQEQAPRRASLQRLAFDVSERLATPLEGGDVVVLPDGGALLGHGFRSSVASTTGLERFLEAAVTPLRVVDPALYHLDMVVSVVDPHTVLVCRDALAPESFSALARRVGRDALVEIARTEAMSFALNAVVVNRDVILASPPERVARILGDRGFRVHATPLDQFHLAGGSAACLVNRVHLDPRDAAAAGPSAAGQAA